SFRVRVPLPEDPYEAIRQDHLDRMDTESEPFKDPIDTETPKTARMAVRIPPAMSSGLSASMAEVAAIFVIVRPFFTKVLSRYDKGPIAVDGDLAVGDEGLAAGVEVLDTDDERHGVDDKSHGLDDEGHSVESDGLGLEKEEAVPEGQQQTAPVERTIMSVPLGLRYGALRCQDSTLEDDHVYSTFEVGQGPGSAPESERPERVSASRQPTLTTWTDPEDDMVYIDVLAYPPPAPPIQTPPSLEWTYGLLPISPSPSVVPSPASSPMISLTVPSPVATPTTADTEGFLTELGAQIEMQRRLICNHAVRLEELSPLYSRAYCLVVRAARDDRSCYCVGAGEGP
nr:hypothetical protein [Tanacetum cinerariifolium]